MITSYIARTIVAIAISNTSLHLLSLEVSHIPAQESINQSQCAATTNGIKVQKVSITEVCTFQFF